MNFDNRYLIAYLTNNKKIDDFMIIYNFYIFLREIPFKTKDNNIYQIKLKWLMDSLISSDMTGVVQVDEFKKLLQKHTISIDIPLTIIESKNIDLDNFPFESQDNLIQYARNTEGLFWLLWWQIISKNDEYVESIIDSGANFLLLEIIKLYPFKKKQGIYPFIYNKVALVSKDNMVEIEQHNISYLLNTIESMIIKSKNLNPANKAAKKLRLINYFTLDSINKLRKFKLDINKYNMLKTSKSTYLKICLSYIFSH